MYHPDDTIAAIASAGGGAARGIVRASGPRLLEILDRCFVAASDNSPSAAKTARVISGLLTPPAGEESISAARIPCELFLWPSAQSYTREPAAELHLPGSPPLMAAALRRLVAGGARLAEPGEFTLRAFLAGRIDLTEAEAVLGVVDAANREALDAALTQLAGGIGRELAELRSTLLDLVAHLEAGLDFADEDLPFITAAQLDGQLRVATQEVERLLDQMTSRAEAAEATRVVLVGQPNVGKSSLFNALAGSGAAIVSPVAGTTRDYLTATVDLGGLRLEIVDTAGAESASDSLGAAAQAMTAAAARPAAIRVLCIDSTRPLVDAEWSQLSTIDLGRDVIVLTKCDQPRESQPVVGATLTSATTGAGIDALGDRLATLAGSSAGGVVLATAVRSRESLRSAEEALRRAAASTLAVGGGEELIAADLRLALDELGKVAGAVHTDDILDRVFSRFCIGK